MILTVVKQGYAMQLAFVVKRFQSPKVNCICAVAIDTGVPRHERVNLMTFSLTFVHGRCQSRYVAEA